MLLMDSFKGERKAEAGLGDGAPSPQLIDLAGGVTRAHTTVSSSRHLRHTWQGPCGVLGGGILATTDNAPAWASRGFPCLLPLGTGAPEKTAFGSQEVWGHVDCYRMLL